MVESQTPLVESATVTKNIKKTKINTLAEYALDFFAGLFWIYVILKLFVFEIDVFLVEKFLPSLMWLLEIKFFIIMISLALFWFFTSNRKFFFCLLYVLFYPFLFVFWKIPKIVLKQNSWVFAFALINCVLYFFKSAQYNFISLAAYLGFSLVIFKTTTPELLWLSAVIIVLLLSSAYVRQFLTIYKPSSIFQMYKKVASFSSKSDDENEKNLTGFKEAIFPIELKDEIKNLPIEKLDDKQLKVWTDNLQNSVLYNRVCLLFAKKIENYLSSGFIILSYIMKVFVLLATTVFSFAVVNYALFKIDAKNYIIDITPNFSDFLYYSCNVFLFNSSSDEISASGVWSQSLNMMEWFYALLLVVMFVTLYFSFSHQRYSDELKEIKDTLEQNGAEIESFIVEAYRMDNIDEAIKELEKLKSGMFKFINIISKAIQ